MSKEKCSKCGGTGSYMYDENHGKPCEVCCEHNQGWWQLTEHYSHPGWWCCRAGCGEIRKDRPDDADVGHLKEVPKPTEKKKDNVFKFPQVHVKDRPNEALEFAKGWGFDTVFICGHVTTGGSEEGTILVSGDGVPTAKDMLFMARLLEYTALKRLGFYD